MDTPQARQRAASHAIKSLDDLSDVLASSSRAPELLSLDIFDTVLTRACGRPADLFLWLGRRLTCDGVIKVSPEAFAQTRANAEQAVWRREGGLDSTVGLPDFYAEVVHRLHLKASIVPDLVHAELLLEADVLNVVPSAQRLIEHCQKLGLPVVYTSDTYFPTDFIEAKLRAAGLLAPGSFCLVSSEKAASKASGRLFQNLISDDRLAGNILHVGDHAHSDVAVARQIGIDTRWCTDARLNRFEERLSDAAPSTSGFSSSMAGASRMARLAIETQNDKEAAIRDVAAGVAGPALLGYVLWILKRAQALSIERLVFLARDGQVLADLARQLLPRLGLSIEIRYLYVSRRSTNLAATFDANEEEVGWVFRDVSHLSSAEFLSSFDLKWADVSEFLASCDSQTEHSSAMQISEAFREQLKSGPIRELVLDRASARRDVVTRYFEQEGLLDDASQAIIDFGGVGSQIRAVHDLIKDAGGRPPHIFMIGLDKPEAAGLSTPSEEPEWVAATDCYLYDHRRSLGIKRSRGFGTCVQMFCAADHGTVIGYQHKDNVVVPDLACRVDEPMIEWGLELYRSTLASFVDHLVLDRDLVDPFADVRDVTCALITEFWTRPDKNEAEAWGNFPLEGAQASGSKSRALAYPYTVQSISREMAAGRFPNLGWQHWYEGSLAISGAPIRKILNLAESAYRSSEKKSGVMHSALAAGIRRLAGR